MIQLATVSHLPEVNLDCGAWVSRRIWGTDNRFEKYCSFSVFRDGEQMAGVILHNWDEDAGVIEISAAGSGNWQSRRLINQVFNTCFDVMKCQMIVMRGMIGNDPMIRNSEQLGFVPMTVPRLGGRTQDMVLFFLTDDDWRASRFRKE